MSCKDVDKKTMKFFDKIFGLDPMFFSKVPNIKSGQEIQREQMRGHMGLTDTEGMTITEENLKKLMTDLSRSISVKGRIILGRMVYKDFSHFVSVLMEKYFTKEKK